MVRQDLKSFSRAGHQHGRGVEPCHSAVEPPPNPSPNPNPNPNPPPCLSVGGASVCGATVMSAGAQ